MVISGNKKLTELVQLSSESIPDQSEHPTNMLLKFVCFSHGWNFANKVKFDSLCLPANICPLLTPTKKKILQQITDEKTYWGSHNFLPKTMVESWGVISLQVLIHKSVQSLNASKSSKLCLPLLLQWGDHTAFIACHHRHPSSTQIHTVSRLF